MPVNNQVDWLFSFVDQTLEEFDRLVCIETSLNGHKPHEAFGGDL